MTSTTPPSGHRRSGTRAARRLVARASLAFCFALAPLHAVAQEAAPSDEPLFEASDAWYAAAFVLGTVALAPLDLAVADAIQDERFQTDRFLGGTAGVARFLGYPGALIVSGGLYAGGLIVGDRALAGSGLHTGGAILIAGAVTYLGKAVVGRARPKLDVESPFQLGFMRGLGNDDYRSFPSGHTTAAFAMAGALATEIGTHAPEVRGWAGVALYGAATLVGISRLYHNEHWASDVVAGAAIGTFSGWKVVRWMHANPNNELDRLFLPDRPDVEPPPVLLQWSVPVP